MDDDVKRDIIYKYYAVRDLLATLFEYATGKAEGLGDADAAAIVKEAEDTLDSMYDDVQATFF